MATKGKSDKEKRAEMAKNVNKREEELWIRRNAKKYGLRYDEDGKLAFTEEGYITKKARAVAERELKKKATANKTTTRKKGK